METISRSSFLKGGVAAAGVAAVATAMAGGQARALEAGPNTAWDYEVDVAIVGSGLGGFAAAFGAHELGATTAIIEVSTTTGGGSSFCGGMIHKCATGETSESYDEYTEGLNKNQDLAHAYINDFQDFIDWMLDLGLSTTPTHLIAIDGQDWGDIAFMGPSSDLGTLGCRPFFDSCEEVYAEQGGTLLLETVAEHVLTDENGTIVGVQCRDVNTEEVVNVKAKSVVLATGGFQADPELRARYWGKDADMATIHAVPYATGSGLKMAQELGASMAGSMSTFAGNYAPAFPARNLMLDPEAYEACGYPEDGRGGKYWLYDNHLDFLADGSVYINLEGERFCDEGEEDYRPQQAIVRQTHATAIMVADDPTFQQWWNSDTYTYRKIREEFEDCILSEESGGALYEADSLEELADKLAESKIHKVAKANFLRTMAEYNEAAAAGTTAELRVPRELGNIVPLTTPPFHAYPVTISVYAPFGGIAVDINAQVLDKNNRPIPGLFAAFPAAGGFMRELYTGAVGCAGVTGRWAGRSAGYTALNG